MNKIEILGGRQSEFEKILTPETIDFVADLERNFSGQRQTRLTARKLTQTTIDSGTLPSFPISRANQQWQINPLPADLQERRVEITGPAGDRKMVINAFNSDADVYMADFEDSQSPTWSNTLWGQVNLFDFVRNNISYTSPEGKKYALNEKTATLMVRPRGWHLLEKNVLIDGRPISASLFDFGIFFYHNARQLLEKSSGPYFYLPKMENAAEAELWNDVFVWAQDKLSIPQGSIKATVLVETILAAFETEEILFALKEHSAGLNCGRWDYIFSFIKKFSSDPNFILPDRALVTMDKDFLLAYSKLVIQTCHRHDAHAIGGMAAQIPIKNNPEANEKALAKVIADKTREAQLGHDGAWVAHPGLAPVVREVFDKFMPGPNNFNLVPNDLITPNALLKVPEGEITEEGLKINVDVGVRYLDSWLKGNGCVPINNLMEDTATAEICRAQVWQWLKHGKMSLDLVEKELLLFKRPGRGVDFFQRLIIADEFPEFLTTLNYEIGF